MISKFKIWINEFRTIIAFCFNCKTLFKTNGKYIKKHGTRCYFCNKNEGFATQEWAILQAKEYLKKLKSTT